MSQSETIFKYNNFEAEFDFLDADASERFEASMNKLREDEKTLPKEGTVSKIVRAQCKWLRDFFDRIFGEGSGEKICGARDSFRDCKTAYTAFLDFIDAQKQDYINSSNEVRGKYSANRAQRRHPAQASAAAPKRGKK